MAFGEMYSSLSSYKSLDAWTQTMSSAVAGAGKVGFKAPTSTFLSGAVTQYQQGTRTPVRIGEQNLNQQTTIDWSQGDLVDTSAPNQFAIKGEGFFLLIDDQGDFYYTRGGNFTLSDGKLKTPEGLTVVDKAMLQTLTRQPGFTLPVATVAGVAAASYNGIGLSDTDLFTATSPWVKPQTSNGPAGSMWLPFINTPLSQQSQYFENPDTNPANGNESYFAQDVAFRKSFFIDDSNPAVSSQLTVNVDNAAFVWVNGHQLSKADLTAPVVDPNNPWGGYPVASGGNVGTAASTFNIAPYLENGVNTIEIMGAEWTGNEGLVTSGNVTLTAGSISLSSGVGTGSTWSAKLIGPDLDSDYYKTDVTIPYISRQPSPPTQTYEDRMFNAEARDFLLVTFDAKDGLRYSKYGNTIYTATPLAGNMRIEEQNTNGVGRVLAGKLETANVDFDNITGEMKLAEHLYDGVASILEARFSMIDTMFQMLLP